MTTLLKTEAKLLLREPLLVFWGVAFPLVLLTVMGLAGRKPDPDLGGFSLVQTYVPVLISLTFTIMGVSALPTALATYRERGVLKRFATTPVRPSWLLAAQLAIEAAMAAMTSILIVAVARIAFGVTLPRAAFAFVLALVLAAAALLSLGVLVAALAPRAKVAGAVGTMLFFPLMFFAGLWAPRATMGHTLRMVGDYTPLGAAVQALQDATAGAFPDPAQLAVMAAYALVCAGLAIRLFRWQ
jgi:ABC-2 type transport system permease protein